MVPSVLASSVCWSLQCLISALTQRGQWWTLFLGSLVQLCCGDGGMLQTNNTGVCLQCLSHTGPAPAHGACALPAHTAQALACSARNHVRPALGCMLLPDLSHSGSGTWVVLRGMGLVGPAFCALPRCEQLWSPGVGERGRCNLSLPLSLPLGFLGVQPAHLLRRMLTKPSCSLVNDASLGS